jgi:DNA polymerase-3 subunit gamma/tau
MGQALYRIYRSKSLDEVVGQEHITDVLKNAVAKGRINHAYLFTGPRGVGKTSIARILAHEINKLPYTDESTHLDIIEIDAASNRRIDDIRDLREKVHITPTSAAYKVYIIDEVHMLTGESFNALLKTLEEPPEHVVFILATTEVHKLPATIVSRTQRYTFRPIAVPKVVAHLRHIADKEKLDITDEALELIAEHGEGSFRDSISLLDQMSTTTGKIDASAVEQTLGLAPRTQIESIIEALLKKDVDSITKQINSLEDSGASVSTVTRQLVKALQVHAVKEPQLYHLLDQLLDVQKAYDPRIKLLTTLLLFVLPKETAPAAQPPVHRAAAVATPSMPALTIASLPTKKPATPKLATAKPSSSPAKTQEAVPDGALTQEQWEQVLVRIKAENPPLYSVLTHARASIENSGKRLVLACNYALHCKKIEDPKHRTKLTAAIVAIAGGCPEIITQVDKTIGAAAIGVKAETAPVAPPTPPESSQAASVLDMMGGGEVLHAPQI